MASKKYKESPIVEAVCEFQFEDKENLSWDLTTPGLIYEEVRDIFPTRRQSARITLGITQEAAAQLGTIPLIQFFSKDEKSLIQLGPNILSINVLKPYPSWQAFLPLIKKGLTAYRDVVAPQDIQRVGLRYINQIAIPSGTVKLEEYFEFRPFVGPNLPQDYGAFNSGIQIPFEDFRDALSLQLGSQPNSDGSTHQANVILSLDYFLLQPKSISLDGVFEWIDTAHIHIEDVFEASVTQKLKASFEEVR